MAKQFYYFHLTIQPYNCDGLRNTNYLSECLIEDLDKVLQDLTQKYSWSVEDNENNDDRHIHCALHLKSSCSQQALYDYFNDFIHKYYTLNKHGLKRCIRIDHKTETQLYLLTSGYFEKQGYTANNKRYKQFNFDADRISRERENYLKLKKESELKEKYKTFLNPNRKDLLFINDISQFCKCLRQLYEIGTVNHLFSLEKYGELHIFLLKEYKISFDISQKNRFLRYFTEFLISQDIETELEKQSLVNYFYPKKEEYISTSIERYFVFD